MRIFRLGSVAAATAIFITTNLAYAQEVTLKSQDGSISVTGELLEFTGDGYRLQSSIGEVFIKADSVSCSGDVCPAPELLQADFTISGASSIIGAMMPALLEGFAIDNDNDVVIEAGENQNRKAQLNTSDGSNLAGIELVSGGTSAGLADLLDGNAALAVTTRAIIRGESDAFAAAELGNLTQSGLENVLALDGLLIVTSQENPVRAITEADTARIFAGQVSNWAEIGGNDAPINLYIRAEGTGSGVAFNGLVMRPNGVKVSQTATVLATDAEISDTVASDPNGIGFSSYSNRRNAKSLAIRGVCGIQTPATAFTIKTEEYPLSRRLYVYKTDKPLPPIAAEFLEYALSAEAQQVIAETGFVDQAVSEVGVNGQGLRFVSAVLPSDAEVTFEQIREMMAALIAGDRLSITYRFEQGSARLDTRAESDIIRLANLLANGDYGNKEIMLLGFTDSVGSPEINQKLSLARAEQVRDALVAAAPAGSLANTPITAIGYGEMSPLGCNETTNGRFINRRVEVWTRDVVRSSQ